MKKILIISLFVEMIIILLFFSTASSVDFIEKNKFPLNMNERFLVDRKHNSENVSYELIVFQSASNCIKDLKKTKVGIMSGPMDSQWPVASYNIQHTGRSPYNTTSAHFVEKWRFPADGWIYGSPVINQNGSIYFSGYSFFAIDSNGTMKWKTDFALWVHSTPAIDENGTIYAGTAYDSPNRLYAFNPDGTIKWSFITGNHIFSSPVISDDGVIYFGDYNGNLYALKPNGTVKWITPNIYSVFSSPAIGEDGTIFCTSWSEGNVYAIFPDNGTIKWQFLTGGQTKANPSIAEDGTIYVSSWDDYLYALYPNNGTMKWRVNTKYGSSNNPSIGPDGTIYIAHVDLYAINPNGTVKWIFPLGDERDCSFAAPAISADGTIYIGANIGDGVGGELIVVNPDGTEQWRSGSICNEGIVSSPAIAEDGTVYIGSLNDEEYKPGGFTSKGFIHAFGPGETKKAVMEQPLSGKVYFLGTELFSTLSGKTIVLRNVIVKADAASLNQLDHIGFFVDGNPQYNISEPPLEWDMNKNYYKGIIERHTIRITAFYKGGCEWSEERVVTYIRLL